MSELDDRARLAAARLRESVGAVSPRPRTTMAPTRTRALAAAAAVLVVVAVVAAVLTSSHHSSRTSDLAPTAPAPAGIPTRSFAPAGLGAALTIPAKWVDTAPAPASGAQFTARGGPPEGFVLAAVRGGVVPITLSQFAAGRRQLLQSLGGVIDSVKTGTVDNHPAVRLQYKLSAPSGSVVDTEYDILSTSTLPVGASQHQTIYNLISIVVGTPVSHPDQALEDWVGSTIRVT